MRSSEMPLASRLLRSVLIAVLCRWKEVCSMAAVDLADTLSQPLNGHDKAQAWSVCTR